LTKIKRALISVFDKEGIAELAQFLIENEIEIISSGGTKKYLAEKGIKAISVEDVTGFPEMLEGRVKTLHPNILAGVLAKHTPDHLKQLQNHQLSTIDLIVVNLYPFEETIAKPDCTLELAIEQIDIGGPTLLRSAAKNSKYTTVLTNPNQYKNFKQDFKNNSGNTSEKFRHQCAVKVFQLVSRYDSIISDYLSKSAEDSESLPENKTFHGKKIQDLRYGENPHQKAAFYKIGKDNPLNNFAQLHGKELSYNNILDLNAALSMLQEFSELTCVILKHNNPCGAGMSDNPKQAFELALSTDPLSAFGGIIGFNCEVDIDAAELLSNVFFECIIAPGYSDEALSRLQKKKNLRLIQYDPTKEDIFGKEIRIVQNGLLIQDKDSASIDIRECKVVTKRQPEEFEWEALSFAWKIVKHVRSNAIVFADNKRLVGVGAGQMSRVDSTDVAIMKANNVKLSTKNTVVASDAFFPFRDGIESLAKAGATAVIQPGGSIRDEEVIEAANENNIAMVFTGMRHFKH